jgi:RNA recognition motif-containing protein
LPFDLRRDVREYRKGNGDMSTKLYVGNLSFGTTEETLRNLFEADGRRVEEVAVVMDRDTGRPRGFAFIQMGTPEDAKNAIAALNGREVDGRQLNVSEARERTDRGGGRGGFGGGRGGFGGGGGGRGRY